MAEKRKALGEITRQDIEDFISHLESLKEKGEMEQAQIDLELREKELREKADISSGLGKPKRKNASKEKRIILRFPRSAKRRNTIIQAGTVALSWAFNKEMIDRDVTKGITWYSGKSAERQILSPELAAAVFRTPWKDERSRLANMLAMIRLPNSFCSTIWSVKSSDKGQASKAKVFSKRSYRLIKRLTR
ncbi:MAG: hypothetical protein FWC45_02405 [Treponema sp.]|nr:hypothetical protein [Treponema sp.]